MERVFSVEEIPDPYWAQPSPRASAAPGAGGGAANAQTGGGGEGGAMNRCPSEWYFQIKFLEESVLDSPADPSPMAATNEALMGGEAEEVNKPAVSAPVAATSAVVDPVEYNAMLKQKLEKDLAVIAMWRASRAMPPERFAASSSLPNADVPHIGTSNPIGGNVVPVQNKLVGGASGGSGPHLLQNVDALVKQAASSSSREQSDDDDMEGEDEITGNATPTDQRLRRRKQSNWESARRSRSGKAAHLNEPEAQVSQLRVENSSLIRRLADVNQKYNGAAVDNRVLKADVETLRAKMSSEDMEMGNESESDLEVQNQESEEGDGRGKEIVQVDEETMDGLERKKEEESAALNKDKEDGDAKTGRKEMAARSEMWNHFTKIFVEGVLRKGKCKYCKREIKAHAVKNGTSALQKHFGVCKRNPHIHLKDPKQGVLQVTDFVGCWKFDPDKLRAAFSQMIIEDELPFAFGEKSGFKKFMFVACPRFKPPSRRTCTRDAVGTYYEEKAKLKLFFQEQCERVCITTDCWTSQQQDSYMTVTAHFIDKEWKLHKKIINFFKIKGHRGDDIGKHLLTCLMEWGLDKVMTITVDNASSNDGGISYVRKHMKSLIAGGKYLHMRCAAHIVNLIVSDGLKEVDVSVKRVRAAVRYVKNGTTRLDKFKECADLEKVDTKAFLNLDVCTRWNSTHDMLKAAIIYEKVFTRYADEDPYFSIDLLSEKSGGVQGLGIPEELDWDNAKKMAEFLGHFADLTVRVSASLNVTSNTFFHEIGEVNLLVRSWLESEDSLQREMGKRMKDKYDKYWGKWHEKDLEKEKGKGKEKENINLMIFMAAVLDPRYKLSEYTEIAIGEMYGEGNGQKVWSAINKCLHELFEEYRAMYAPVASDSPPQSSDAPRKETGKGGSASMMKELIAKKMRLNTGASNSSKSELEKYLAEDCEDIESKIFDILDWWKTNSSRFPILAQLARDVLAIPISTVASESAFSMGGRVLDDFRTSLTPFMVEAIVCTQDWLRRSTPINIQENTEELAKLEEELIKEFKNEATI